MKRRKGAGGSLSKKGKAQEDTSHYERVKDPKEPIQEEEQEHEPEEHELQNGLVVMFGKCMKKFLNKDKITKEYLEGLAFELLKKRFKNSVELEYNLEQCHLALTDKTDWANPKGNRFYDDLSKPLPLVRPPGKKTIPISYFFNRDLEYLKYGNEEKNVQRIKVNKKYGYAYLEEIVVKRTDKKEYMFVEADILYLHQNDIEDLYLLKIQNKIYNINVVDEFDLINVL
ncbi:hypothetical protein Tco_1407507 [Tanacetum coccineum]